METDLTTHDHQKLLSSFEPEADLSVVVQRTENPPVEMVESDLKTTRRLEPDEVTAGGMRRPQ